MKLEVLSCPAQTPRRGRMLFVHGVCHGAWCWHNYLDYFAKHGYDTYALSLRGHGESDGREHLSRWGLSDYVTDVVSVLHSISEENDKPIVVGHSMGGGIVQKLIGEHQELVQSAVLLAPVEKGGVINKQRKDLLTRSFFQAFQFLSLVGGDAVTEDKVANSLFINHRLTSEEITRITPLLQEESKAVLLDLALSYTPYYENVTVPVMVLGSSADLFFSTESLRITASAYGIEPVVLSDMCHDMMLDIEWERGAEAILAFIQN